MYCRRSKWRHIFVARLALHLPFSFGTFFFLDLHRVEVILNFFTILKWIGMSLKFICPIVKCGFSHAGMLSLVSDQMIVALGKIQIGYKGTLNFRFSLIYPFY